MKQTKKEVKQLKIKKCKGKMCDAACYNCVFAECHASIGQYYCKVHDQWVNGTECCGNHIYN
ncbi:MAG: hypothetical protein J6T74_01040 [Clostridia bacterium]|nr:hypothetical protein [Clostridia bacterium]